MLGAGTPHMRIQRCVCANAGWYTLPLLPPRHIFPYGLGALPAEEIIGVGAPA